MTILLRMEMLVFRIVILAAALACLASGKIFLTEQNLFYECEKDNTIVITGKNHSSYGSVHAVGTTTNGSNSTCTVEKRFNSSEVTFTITKCNVTVAIQVYVMEEKQDKDITILGGNGLAIYELKCNGIEKGGTNMTKVFNLTDNRDAVTVQTHYQLDVQLALEVTDKANMSLNSSSIVRIGDELHLIISGNNRFKFAAQSCIATEVNNEVHKKNLTHNGMTYDPSVISDFTVLQNYTEQPNRVKIDAILYAFHFLDSDSIMISCTITVCESDDDTCLTQQTGSVRRRRASGFEPYTQSLHATLRVADIERKVVTKNGGSEASRASGGSNLLLVPMISCVIIVIFQFRA